MKLWYDDDLLDLVQEPLWSKPVVHSRAPSLPLHIIAYSLVWFNKEGYMCAVLNFIVVLTKLGMLLKPLHTVLAAVPITDYI
jgi:hypothetical protein